MNSSEMSWESFLKIKNSDVVLIPLKVVTGSMEPLIPVGGTVFVDKKSDYKINDIVVFWHNKKLIVHVLWNVNSIVLKNGKEVIVTRSLRSKVLDTSVNREQILGKVINYKLRYRDFIKLYILQRPI